MRSRSLITFLVLLFPLLLAAQAPSGLSPKRAPFELAADLGPDDYVPQVLVMKVKEQYRDYCTGSDIAVPGLERYMEALGKAKLQRSFPHTDPPSEPYDALGRKMVDLSLVYEFQYSENDGIEDAANLMLGTGLFEYVEPLYIYQPFYQPNDPDTASQYYLSLVRAYSAWDVSKGDTSVVIGIIDTGTSFGHPELASEHVLNAADPIDGMDNDGDGYVDNYRGWDFGGDYWLSPGDNDPTWAGTLPGVDHGVIVSGPAGAATDNGTNIASIGFDCRLMQVKVSIDQSPSIYRGYQGVVYAADHGCDIINLSWGGTARSRMGQEAIDYAAINQGKLVVVAGGNTPADIPFIPATYHNVLGVTGSEQNDQFWNTSATFGTTYHFLNDLCAPSRDILTTGLHTGTFTATGTSLGAPIVAGAAGLVKAQFPNLSMAQVGQRVRVTADQNIYSLNPGAYSNKMGRGRVDVHQALVATTPSVRVLDYTLADPEDGVIAPNDTIDLALRFVNYLDPVNNLQVSTVVPNSSTNFLEVVHGDIDLGTLNTLDTASLRLAPFRIRVKPGTPDGYVGYIKINYNGNGYSDWEYLRITTDADYITVNEGRMELSFNGTGRWGYMNYPGLNIGQGLTIDAVSGLMNDAGFLIGNSPTDVSDNFQNQNGTGNNHFFNLVPIEKNVPGQYADAEATTTYNELTLGAMIKQNTYQFELGENRNYIIQEYEITNSSITDTLHDAYAGMYFDLDGYWRSNNVSKYDTISRCIYNFTETWVTLWNIGVALLTPDSLHGYAEELSTFGFSTADKWAALTSPPQGAELANVDLVQFASAGPFTIPPAGTHRVAFAIVTGDSVPHLRENVQKAKDKYFCVIRGGMAPQVDLGGDILHCNGDTTLSLDAGAGYSSYLWDDGSTGQSRSVDTTGNYWVQVTDANGCEDYDQIHVAIGEGFNGGFTCAPQQFYVGDTIQFADTTAGVTEWGWDFGDGSIVCPIYPNTEHVYTSPGTYTVQMFISNGVCTDTVTKTLQLDTLVGVSPPLATGFALFPNPAQSTVKYAIDHSHIGEFQLFLRNALGQEIKQVRAWKDGTEVEGELDLGDVGAGMYFVEVRMGEVRMLRRLVVR